MQREHQPIYAASHALVVGINSYSDPRFVPLGKAEDDARAMAALLSDTPYHFKIASLMGQQATRQAILSELHKLRRAQSDDRILVYFAGHGYTLTDLYGHETGYLAASDTVPDQDYTALEMDEMTGLVRHAPAKHIAFIFDACFSGQALGLTRTPAIAAEKYLQRRAFQVLSAGAGDQTVSDFRSMTSTLVEALQTGVVSRDGLVTFSELGLHVQQVIASDSGQTQIPQFGHLRGSQGGDFIFYREEGVRLPPDLDDALRSEMSNTRRGAVADLIDLARSSADPAVALLARERLMQISKTDASDRVRLAAARFFEVDEPFISYDSTQDETHSEFKSKTPSRAELETRDDLPAVPDPKEATTSGLLPRPAASLNDTPAIRETMKGFDKRRYEAAKRGEAIKRQPSPRQMQNITMIGIGVGILAMGIIGIVLIANAVRGALRTGGDPTKTPEIPIGVGATDEPTDIQTGGVTGLIAFTHLISRNTFEVVIMNVDGSGRWPVGSGSAPAWSPNGTQLAYACGVSICLYDLVTGSITASAPLFASEIDSAFGLDWSPDGDKIVYHANSAEGTPDIFLYDPAKESAFPLTTDPGFDILPAWINTDSIAYLSDRANANGVLELHFMLSDGSSPSLVLSDQGNLSSVDFAADKYLFVADNGIYILPHGSSDPLLVIHGNSSNMTIFGASWSVDAQHVLFSASVDDDPSDVYVINADGSNLTNITKTKTKDEISPVEQPSP